MKLTTVILITTMLHVSAATLAQKFTMMQKNVPLKQVFKEIRKQTGYNVLWGTDVLNASQKVNVNFSNIPLEDALRQILDEKVYRYVIEDKTLLISKKEEVWKETPAIKRQNVIIYGQVLDNYKRPLAGVNVTAKDTKVSVITSGNGTFIIPVTEEGTVLVFSYIGYKIKEIKAGDPAVKQVVMTEDIAELDQVQVLGFSTTTKRLNTGTTSTIRSEELQKNPVPNVLQALAYRIPGLSINQPTGVHDGSFNVKIRGINGFNAVDPLYVIDGVPYPAGGNNGNAARIPGGLPVLGLINSGSNGVNGVGSTMGGNAMNYINMNDIESIDILKDAASTSVYGSSGAYGVVLITTKKAKGGKPSLDVSLNHGIEMRGNTSDMLNTADYLAMRREALKNDGLTPTASDVDINGTYPEDRYTNFQKLLQGRAASSTRINGSYSAGANGTNFLISGGFNTYRDIQNSKGAVSDGTIRVNLNSATQDNKFSINFTGSFGSKVNDMVHYDFSGVNANSAPNSPPALLPDGSINWELPGNDAAMKNSIYKGVTNNLLGSTNLSYRPFKGLAINANFGYNLLAMSELSALPSTVFDPKTSNISQRTSSVLNSFSIRSLSMDPSITYTTKLGSKGTLTTNAVATLSDRLMKTQTISGKAFTSDALIYNPSSGSERNMSDLTSNTARKIGYIGMVNYNWGNKFIADFSLRYDGSAVFGPSHRYGTFGAGALAYIFTEEKWVKENLSFLSFGKIKASRGTAGGDGVAPFSYLGNFFSADPYLGSPTLMPSKLENPDLGWEKNLKTDLGLELGFFKDRINIGATLYRTKTTDQLTGNPLSSVTGFLSMNFNTPAVMQNQGLELSVISRNINGKNFSWTSNISFTRGSSKLLYFPPELSTPSNSWVVGNSITAVRVANYAGIDPQTGLATFINRNGVKDPFIGPASPSGLVLTPLDFTETVELYPKYEGSISNTIRYKSFSLDFTFTLVNRMGRNYYGQQFLGLGYLNMNTSYAVYNNRWQKPGDIAQVPKATTNIFASLYGQSNFANSTGAYERIIYSKLQNLQLAYSLPDGITKRIRMKRVDFFLQGQNLLTISKYGTLDPENLSVGALPPMRVFNFGLNLSL